MQFKALGRTGVQVSELCFGTMSFGGDADAGESAKLYRAARDAGINFFDCADVYSHGEAERLLGRCMAGERDELVIASKVGMAMGEGPNDRGASRRHIQRAVEDSLRRLGTDRLDLLYMHQWLDAVPLEEILRCLENLVRQGKVLILGASNYAAWQLMKGLGISTRNGWSRFDVIQPMYNLVKRQAESEILPLAMAEELAVVSYGPVGGGLLSGRYGTGLSPAEGRLVDNEGYGARYGEPWVYEVASRFTEFAGTMGIHPVSLAVAWVRSHPQVTCPILGARDVAQLQPSLDCLRVEMTPELRARISSLSREPALATDRLEERREAG